MFITKRQIAFISGWGIDLKNMDKLKITPETLFNVNHFPEYVNRTYPTVTDFSYLLGEIAIRGKGVFGLVSIQIK